MLVTQRDREERSKKLRTVNVGPGKGEDYASADERALEARKRNSEASRALGESNLPDIYKKFFMEDVKAAEALRGEASSRKNSKVRVVVASHLGKGGDDKLSKTLHTQQRWTDATDLATSPATVSRTNQE